MNLDRLTAYELVKQEELKDIKGFGTVLTHVKSGARIALIETEDENKTFSIANARYFHSKDTARRVGRAVYYNQ